MASSCEKCQGEAVPAARTRTFEYEGQTLRCLALVSCCMVCGHQWEDDTYNVENARFEEEARVAVVIRRQFALNPHRTTFPAVQRDGPSQSH
jgi:hypothetical protein